MNTSWMFRSILVAILAALLGSFRPAYADLFVLGATYSGTFSTYAATGVLTNADATPTCQGFIGSSNTAVSTATVTNMATGRYRYELPMTTGNGYAAGSSYSIRCTATVAGQTQDDDSKDGIYLLGTPAAAGVLSTNVTQFGGTNGTFVSGRPEVEATSVRNGAVTSGSFATGAFTATAFAANSIPDTALSAAAVTKIQTNLVTITKNVAVANYYFKLTKNSAGFTGGTSGTITCQVTKDGGAFGGCNAATQAAITEVSGGWYKTNVNAADVNANILVLRFYVPTDSMVVPWEQEITPGR